jgi:hypothetical protein
VLRGIVVLVVCGLCAAAHAQRGEDVDRTPVGTSGFDGFPGFFDTGTVNKGHFQADYLPLPGLRYGVTDEASLRLSALPLLAFSNGGYGLGIELRHRMWHDDRFNVVGTLAAMYANFGTLKAPGEDGADDIEIDNYAITTAFAVVTADWRLSKRHVLALTVLAGQVKLGGDQHVGVAGMARASTSQDASMLIVLATQTYFVRGVLGLQWGLGYAPYLHSAARGAGNTTDIDLGAVIESAGAVAIVPRAGIFVRTRRWLMGVSVTGIIPSIELSQTW